MWYNTFIWKVSVQPIWKPARFFSGESAPSFTTIKYWVAEFKRGRPNCQDKHRSGRPNKVTMTEMVQKIYKMVLDDRRLKVRELSDKVGISRNAVHCILTENLDMRKLCAKWVPRLLTMDSIQRREDVSIECLTIISQQSSRFFALIHNSGWNMGPLLRTWDEGTPKTMDWKGSVGSKEGGDSSICWQGHGISFLRCTWDNFRWLSSKRKKINNEYFANFSQRLSDEIKKFGIWKKRKCYFIKTMHHFTHPLSLWSKSMS